MKNLTAKNILLVLSLVLNALNNAGIVPTAVDAPPAPSTVVTPCAE